MRFWKVRGCSPARFSALGRVAITVLLALICGACVSRTQPVETCYPAKSPQAVALKRVAVLPFQGDDGSDAALSFESLLTQAQDRGQPVYAVVDRRSLDKAIAELKMQQSGMMDEKTVKRIGKLLGADGIYTGVASAAKPVTRRYTREGKECTDSKRKKKFFSCDNWRTVSETCTERSVQYTLTPRLTSVQSGEVVYQRSITQDQRQHFCGDERIEAAPESLLQTARKLAFEQVRTDVSPYCLSEALVLKSTTDGIDPSSHDVFEDAVAFAESGRMDRSCATWSSLESQNPTSLALQFNLGVCEETAGRLDDALARFAAADRLLSRPDGETNEALRRVRYKIDSQAKLQQQNPAPPAPGRLTGQKVPTS